MRASAYGLDSPRETYTPPPCAADPTGWDIPEGKRPALPRVQVTVAARAVRVCRACPQVDECAAMAELDPPDHPCVRGGLVWWPMRAKRLRMGISEFRQYRIHGRPLTALASPTGPASPDDTVVEQILAGRIDPTSKDIRDAQRGEAIRRMWLSGMDDVTIAHRMRVGMLAIRRRRQRHGWTNRGAA